MTVSGSYLSCLGLVDSSRIYIISLSHYTMRELGGFPRQGIRTSRATFRRLPEMCLGRWTRSAFFVSQSGMFHLKPHVYGSPREAERCHERASSDLYRPCRRHVDLLIDHILFGFFTHSFIHLLLNNIEFLPRNHSHSFSPSNRSQELPENPRTLSLLPQWIPLKVGTIRANRSLQVLQNHHNDQFLQSSSRLHQVPLPVLQQLQPATDLAIQILNHGIRKSQLQHFRLARTVTIALPSGDIPELLVGS